MSSETPEKPTHAPTPDASTPARPAPVPPPAAPSAIVAAALAAASTAQAATPETSPPAPKAAPTAPVEAGPAAPPAAPPAVTGEEVVELSTAAAVLSPVTPTAGATTPPTAVAAPEPAPVQPAAEASAAAAMTTGSAPERAAASATRPEGRVVVVFREPSPEAHHLAAALRAEGVEVQLVLLPPNEDGTIADLRRGLGQLANDLVRTLRGEVTAATTSPVAATLAALPRPISAIVAVDADVARDAFAAAVTTHPSALRVAVDGTFHVSAGWLGAAADAWVVSHAGLGAELPGVRDGRARLLVGGLLGGGEVAAKTLEAGKPMVVVSTERLDPADVESLLFQLSMARPERFSLLFLPSGPHGRPGIDELIRVRAPNHGLAGKRPKPGAAIEPWLRGASVLVGQPTRAEAAVAMDAGVPMVLFASDKRLEAGDRFLISHGAALHTDLPITISVHLEALMPGGPRREAALAAVKELEPGGLGDAARAVLEAVSQGRIAAVEAAGQTSAGPRDDDLEDIGAAAPPRKGGVSATSASHGPELLPLVTRKAYLKELILHQHTLERQQAQAAAGLAKWQERIRLARRAGQDDLANQAVPRVEGLMRLCDRLSEELRELGAVRDRLARGAPLAEGDRRVIGRLMNVDVARSIERMDSPESAFTQLEIAEQLASLKRRLGDS
jgi:hypothetical protein